MSSPGCWSTPSTTSTRRRPASTRKTCPCPMRPTSRRSPCRPSRRSSPRPRRSVTDERPGLHPPFAGAVMTDVLTPALSPTMEEGTLAKWHVKKGDKVRSGDVIAEIETDKATMEGEAVDEGTVEDILVP